jgi:hypothetical protein
MVEMMLEPCREYLVLRPGWIEVYQIQQLMEADCVRMRMSCLTPFKQVENILAQNGSSMCII